MEFYLSTIDPNAGTLARKYGAGIELAQFCTAARMDEPLTALDQEIAPLCDGIGQRVLHGPFNELFPCAIDPQARQLAAKRYRQAIDLAVRYGAEKVILHGGYHPFIYYPIWYVEQSVAFWREFLTEGTAVPIVLENVLEQTPELLVDIIKGVDDPRLRLCLDVGHVNAYSQVPVMAWLDAWAPYLSHLHLHNNDTTWDTHSPLSDGTIPMAELLQQVCARCPRATATLELTDSEGSIRWLKENQLWNLP